jgi:hypothetical protein
MVVVRGSPCAPTPLILILILILIDKNNCVFIQYFSIPVRSLSITSSLVDHFMCFIGTSA